jgi:uncharacterized protein (TIGR03435 family)
MTFFRRFGTTAIRTLTVEAQGMRIADFASGLLASRLDRPVVDKTGVAGKFNFHLEFSPAATASGSFGGEGTDNGGGSAPTTDSAGPSIFTAIQEQMGLKLSSDKGPVEVLVVDHVEKPSAN